ncbi:MAG TPA: HK97 family phage prohead protease, partial [Myxococcales bacterium]
MQTRAIRIEIPESERQQAAASKRFPVSISSETPVPRRDPYTGETWQEVLSHSPGAVNIERSPLPLLVAHRRDELPIGVVDGLRLEGGKLRGVLQFGQSARALEVAADVAAGVISSLSIGYTVDVEDRDEAAKKITAVKWTVFETSLVSVPADGTVGVNRSNTAMSVPVPAAPAVNPTPAPAPAELQTRAQQDPADLMIREEQVRVEGIRGLCAKYPEATGPGLAEQLVREHVPLHRAREVVLERLASWSEGFKTENHVRIEGGESSAEKFQRGAEASLLERAGVADLVAEAAKTKVGAKLRDVATDPGEFRGWKLDALAREFLERRNLKTRGWSTQRVFEQALSVRSGMAGTSDFPVLLENTLGKVLLAAYATQPTAWPKFCGKVNVPDFKAASFYRNGSFGTLSPINEHGEYTNKAIPDGEKSSISIGAYGNIIAITRKALIDDDL